MHPVNTDNVVRDPHEGTRPRALIVGAGIAGMATAIRLHQSGWDTVLLERSPERRIGGYFILLFGGGLAAAKRIGIIDRLPDRTPPDGSHYEVDRLGNRRKARPLTTARGGPRRMLRGDVERELFNALPQAQEIHFAAVPEAIVQGEGRVEVTWRDRDGRATTEAFDLVVGADGIRSTVRRLVFGADESYLVPMGRSVFAFQLPKHLVGLDPDDGIALLEKGRAMWTFSFTDDLPSVLITATEDMAAGKAHVRSGTTDKPAHPFEDGEPTGPLLGQVLTELTHAKDVVRESAQQVHMPTWHKGRVVLLGDSAWCLTLYSGMGASTALAGADLLGRMLAEQPGDVDGAIRVWEARLRPFILEHQRLARAGLILFNPSSHRDNVLRWLTTRGPERRGVRWISQQISKKSIRMKSQDIAGAA